MATTIRTRRPPPPFRRAEVAAVAPVTPRARRFTLSGAELAGLDPPDPAASIRLLLPHHGELVVPEWNGNEFLHDDGTRPHLRTLTPLRIDPVAGEVDVDIVLHGAGPMATWAASAAPGDPVAVSGKGRGYAIDPTVPTYLLAGDESALPAITTILAALPATATAEVVIEVGDAVAEQPLGRDGVRVHWHVLPTGAAPGEALVRAVAATEVPPDAHVWVAGEAASVQRIRRHLFEELGVERSRCTVRGYWKHGRAGDDPGR